MVASEAKPVKEKMPLPKGWKFTPKHRGWGYLETNLLGTDGKARTRTEVKQFNLGKPVLFGVCFFFAPYGGNDARGLGDLYYYYGHGHQGSNCGVLERLGADVAFALAGKMTAAATENKRRKAVEAKREGRRTETEAGAPRIPRVCLTEKELIANFHVTRDEMDVLKKSGKAVFVDIRGAQVCDRTKFESALYELRVSTKANSGK